MTEKKSTLITIEKIKAFAIALIGSGIFCMGSTYFSEQSSYRIPRILLPIYGIFGNIGLAIGMIILGALLMYFAYKKFTNNDGKPLFIVSFQIIAILVFYAIIYSTHNKSATAIEVNNSLMKNEKKIQTEISNSERPISKNTLVNAYFDKMETLKNKFEISVNKNNKIQFEECNKEYDSLITNELVMVIKEIGAQPEYSNFIMYNAKTDKDIQVFRVHKW